MNAYVARSRVTKALTDGQLASSFAAAEARLDAVRACIIVGASALASRAGQTAALTALATAKKCFGRAELVCAAPHTALLAPVPLGATIGAAAHALGATVGTAIPADTTHLIRIEDRTPWRGWQVSTWWDRWLAGTRTTATADCGNGALAIAGMFAAALAVRQVFATVRGAGRSQDATISLWEPWAAADLSQTGPAHFVMPNALWLVGLGHLGQAFIWALLSLPYRGERYAVIQDDQYIGIENAPTSLLVTAADIGIRKTRVASRWLDHGGWQTELIERRHIGDISRTERDPPILLSGLDDVRPRQILAGHGFDYMIDAGIGRGPGDFEGLQLRCIPAGTPAEKLWSADTPTGKRDRLVASDAYQALERDVGLCGTIAIADASVAIPFVGAATAALTIAQLARLGSMAPAAALLQLELGAPDMVIDGGLCTAPQSFPGGERFELT
jgi:hypothetical protein